MPWGNGVVLDLKASGENLNGTMRSRTGDTHMVPFDRVILNRIGPVTLSDRVPLNLWENADARSPRLLQLRKDVSDGSLDALAKFWQTIQASRAPLMEPLADSKTNFLVTFVWKGTPDTKNVLVGWPRLAEAYPDDFFMSHVEGTDLWFKTIKVRRGTRISTGSLRTIQPGNAPPENTRVEDRAIRSIPNAIRMTPACLSIACDLCWNYQARFPNRGTRSVPQFLIIRWSRKR